MVLFSLNRPNGTKGVIVKQVQEFDLLDLTAIITCSPVLRLVADEG